MKVSVWCKKLVAKSSRQLGYVSIGLFAILALGLWIGNAPTLKADAEHTAVSSNGDVDTGKSSAGKATSEAASAPQPFSAAGSNGSGQASSIGSAPDSEITPYEVLKTLPTIESHMAGGKAETICGTDTRARVTPTTTFPWRANCQLVMTDVSNHQFIGTGWMGGNGTVFTAGHCVHGGKGGQFFKKVEVIPGMDAATRPYGTFVGASLRTVNGWINNSSPEYDYGAIILKSTDKVGKKTGYYGFAALSDASLNNLLVNTAGYPGDKPFGQQWRTSGNISSVQARRLFYSMDTFGGQSGSIVYKFVSATNTRTAVGIHAYGGCPNGATRIVTPVFNNLLAWRNLNQ